MASSSSSQPPDHPPSQAGGESDAARKISLATLEDVNDKARKRMTYASFGNDGVTASANAHGNLLQLTRYFGEASKEASGFFCAEFSTQACASPYYPEERLEDLNWAIANPNSGTRLQVYNPDVKPIRKPQVSFVGYRWPCFESESSKLPLSVQYVVNENTVYQISTLKLDKMSDKEVRDQGPPKLFFYNMTRIRDLNYMEDGDGFMPPLEDFELDSNTSDNSSGGESSDDDSADSDTFRHASTDSSTAGEENSAHERHCLVSSWVERRPVGLKKKNVGLYVSPFVGDKPKQPPKPESGSPNLQIPVDEDDWDSALKDGKLEVTVAFTLDLFNSEYSPATLPSPVGPNQLDAARKMLTMEFSTIQLSDNPHLDFILWRNLEHILSVCSIPVHDPDNAPPIALTHGDIASHRVATTASFHAFRFLIRAMKRIKGQANGKLCGPREQTCKHGNCDIYRRILRVCQGHDKWLKNNWASKHPREEQASQEPPEPQRWVSGKARAKILKKNPELSHELRIDTALQIIKVAEFSQFVADADPPLSPDSRQAVNDSFKRTVQDWARDLGKAKRGDKHVFPRLIDGEPDMFYFADHALIWWAIKSAEGLELPCKLSFDGAEKANGAPVVCETSKTIRHNFLKRVATENAVTKTRMLATSRSYLDTQFLLGAEETALFHAAKHGLLDEANKTASDQKYDKVGTWTRTEGYQRHHEGNDDSIWTNPIQFALALIMASQGKPINSRPPAEMYEHARSVLMRSSSPNGLLAGMLDSRQMPVFFKEKHKQDSYWSATFEAPYIMWEYPPPPGLPAETLFPQLSSQAKLDVQDLVKIETPAIAKMARQFPELLNLLNSLSRSLEAPAIKEALAIRPSTPFSKSIDQSNIVVLFDDWLCDAPKFFSFGGELSLVALRNFCEENRDCLDTSSVVSQAIHAVYNRREGHIYDGEEQIKAIINDDPEGDTKNMENNARGSKNNAEGSKKEVEVLKSNAKLCERLNTKRTYANPRKRLVQLFEIKPTTALICYIASSKEEGLISFFDRHASYGTYASDDATLEPGNKWVTELHLSFYRVLDQNGGKYKEAKGNIPVADQIEFPSPEKGRHGVDAWVQRAVMSFRFDGDFFDRFWTCHFLEHGPYNDNPEDLGVRLKVQDWKQRRVLELVLFDRILERMIDATKTILRQAKARVLQSLGSRGHKSNNGGRFGIPTTNNEKSALEDALDLLAAETNDAFLSASTLCHKVQHLLQAVEDELENNLETIQAWTNREMERGSNRPRWTQKDEKRFRGTISKWQASNKHKIRELKLWRANNTSYNSSLTRKLEDIRNELDLRGADDIRLFTYVTAVFLPIGFATGVFSMSDPPSKITLGSMIGTAAIALLLTVIALVNAKFLRNQVVTPVIHAIGAAFRTMFSAVASIIASIVSMCKGATWKNKRQNPSGIFQPTGEKMRRLFELRRRRGRPSESSNA